MARPRKRSLPKAPARTQALRQRAPIKPAPRVRSWKLQDAKAKFSEVVRRARSEGPQRVTYRGKDAVVVVAAQEFDRTLPPTPKRRSWVDELRGLELDRIDVQRSRDRGRDIEFGP